MKQIIGRWRNMVLPLGIVVGCLGVKYVSQFISFTMPKQLQDLITLSASVAIEALPFVLLGIILSIAVRVYLPQDWLLKNLPRQPLLRRATISLLGVLLPVCECGNVPLARGLLAKGLTPAESLTFLLAAPILNPVTIITTQQAFAGDTTVVWVRVIGGFLIANLVGWLYSTARRSDILRPESVIACQPTKQPHRTKRSFALELFTHEARSMLPALLIGAGVAGLIQIVVPRDAILLLGNNPAWSVIMMIVLAFVVSICSSVDAFFALAFRGTFTTGSLVSFLVFGPMIDIKMLSLMRTTYRTKVLLQVTLIVALAATCVGLVVNYAL